MISSEYRRSKAQRPSAGNADYKRGKLGLMLPRCNRNSPIVPGLREDGGFLQRCARRSKAGGRRRVVAEYVVEFGKDGRPVEPTAGSMRRRSTATTSRSGRCWRIPRRQIRRRAGGRQRHRPACGAFRAAIPPTSPGGRAISTSASQKHRGVARACGLAEHPPAAADRSVRSRRGARRCTTAAGPANCWRCSAPMSSTSRRGASPRACSQAPARYLRDDGRLFLYGPFKRDGKHTALSNAVFDTSLRDAERRMGRARYRRCREARGRRRSRLDRDRRDARQQSDPGVRRDQTGLTCGA